MLRLVGILVFIMPLKEDSPVSFGHVIDPVSFGLRGMSDVVLVFPRVENMRKIAFTVFRQPERFGKKAVNFIGCSEEPNLIKHQT